MKHRDRPADGTDAPGVKLPGTAALIARDHPALWEAYQRFGEQVSEAGPLDERCRRLVHLAFAIASGSEGATHSHTRRGIEQGLKKEELEHVALLAATTLGWPQAIKGLTWVKDETGG